MTRRLDRSLAWYVAAGVGALAAVLFAIPLGRPDVLGALLVVEDAVGTVDAVFVLSGDVDFHRTRFAVSVFRQAGARWFVVSGAGYGGDSGILMAGEAERAGVPRDSILVEENATSTRENVTLSRTLLESHGIRSVALVTSPFHSRRALLAAKRAWPTVTVFSRPAPEEPYECLLGTWTESCRSQALAEWRKLLGYRIHDWL